jgi:hypothetical protein
MKNEKELDYERSRDARIIDRCYQKPHHPAKEHSDEGAKERVTKPGAC